MSLGCYCCVQKRNAIIYKIINTAIHKPKAMVNIVAELVFIPTPGVGHIMSTIEIAKLLVNRDQHLSITVVIIKPPSSSSCEAVTTYIESLCVNTMNHISFIELPQDETLANCDSKNRLTFFNEFIKSHCKYVRKIVADMISKPCSGRVAGFVIDMFCMSMIDVANELNVPTYMFFTSNAAFLRFKFYIQKLCDDDNQDVIEMINLDTEIPVPGFSRPVPTNVFPKGLYTREGLDFLLCSTRKLGDVKGIMVNTFLELETNMISSLSADISIPTVYPVGPILNIKGGAGKEPFDDDVIKWLDSQPDSSVVFLCFGSMGSFDEVQVKEIAYALELSGYRFVWSLRRPPLSDQTSKVPGDYEDPGVVLPDGFLDRTDGIGKVIGWAPQVTLLAHRAVGGFVTHCGWNSLLESLWFGVPSATWPMYAEQQMNAFNMVVELGLAVEIKLDYTKDVFSLKADTVIVTAKEIESGIKRVMEDNEVRTKVKMMSKKSRAAMAEGGSSYVSVGHLIQDFIKNIT